MPLLRDQLAAGAAFLLIALLALSLRVFQVHTSRLGRTLSINTISHVLQHSLHLRLTLLDFHGNLNLALIAVRFEVVFKSHD